MIPAFYSTFIAGALLVVLSVPLILRMIPRNRFYGIRTAKAFASERNWYDINAFGGWLLIVYGVLMMVFAALTRSHAPPPSSPLSVLFVVGPLLGVVVVLQIVRVYSRRLPDE